jgi:hypothetical protein
VRSGTALVYAILLDLYCKCCPCVVLKRYVRVVEIMVHLILILVLDKVW